MTAGVYVLLSVVAMVFYLLGVFMERRHIKLHLLDKLYVCGKCKQDVPATIVFNDMMEQHAHPDYEHEED